MIPTDEQQQAVDLFQRNDGNLAIEAGAGTGKTSTLVLIAKSEPGIRGQYLAFNKSLVVESAGKFPEWIAANTAHSLAFRGIGYRFKSRLDSSGRMTSREVAQRLELQPMDMPDFAGHTKRLAPSYLASLCSKAITRFCQSDSREIQHSHFPFIDGLDDPRELVPAKNLHVRAALMPYAEKLWADLQTDNGWVPFKHEHYLKMWQLTDPQINADYVLFDEAQDANPVIAAIVAAQRNAQLVYVGDSQQEIYAFTGAVNALANVEVAHRTFLTQSFRFGPAIADAANASLAALNAPLRLRGNPDLASTVGPIDRPRAVLARTNATVLSRLLHEQDQGTRTHVIGGGEEIDRFARAVEELKEQGRTSHPDLVCFSSWADVQAYADLDENGEDLRLMVKLVDSFGTAEIIASVARMTPEAGAELVISTAHKAKGREWLTVQIAPDFSKVKPDDKPSLRLQYVAVTRAQLRLDMEALRDREAV